MLFEMLHEITSKLQDFDQSRESDGDDSEQSKQFVQAWREQRPELFSELNERLGAEGTDRAARSLCYFMTSRILEMSPISHAMVELMDLDTTHPAARCAMIGSLAYLVQPRDLLPDDIPGLFGYVDDCMILRTTASVYFDVLPRELLEESQRLGGESQILQLMAMCIPPRRVPLFQGAMDGVWHLFQRLLALPASQAQETAQALIDDPLGARLPIQGSTPPYGPGPDITKPPGGSSVQLREQQVVVSFPAGGELIL